MKTLIAGLIIFFGVHLLPVFRESRQSLVEKLGEDGYKVLFSLLALAGLGLIIWGKGRSEFVYLWQPPSWGQYAPFILMLPALILIVAANMPGHIRRVVKNPMLIGIMLWSCAHLLANGDLASVLLFGAFAVYSVLDLVSVTSRVQNTESVQAQLRLDILACVLGIVGYVLIYHFHSALFGPPALL